MDVSDDFAILIVIQDRISDSKFPDIMHRGGKFQQICIFFRKSIFYAEEV